MAKYIALDDTIGEYIARTHSGQNDEILKALHERTLELGDISEMQISPEQGTFLRLLVAVSGAKRAIEIGTFTGYSALCIARGIGENGKLLCCDASEEWTAIAREFWARDGIENRIELRLGDAKETLRVLASDEKFDFAFIDADKSGYDTYLELLLPHLQSGALILFDNMLRGGKVAQPLETLSNDDLAIANLNRKLTSDARLESVLLPIADGLMLCRKR